MAQMPKRPPKSSAPTMMETEMTVGRESRKGEAIERVENRGAVGGDAGDEDDGQQPVEEVDGERELGGRKVRGDEREEAAGEKRHERGRGAEKQAHPEHGTREELLGAIAALLFPHPDQRGHERLIHRLGDEVDEQAGNERRGEEGVHGVGAAIDRGDGDLFEGGDELDDDARGADGDGGAEDTAIDRWWLVEGAAMEGRQCDMRLVTAFRNPAPLRAAGTGSGASAWERRKQAVRACGHPPRRGARRRTIMAKSSQVVRFSSTVATSEVMAQTSSEVTQRQAQRAAGPKRGTHGQGDKERRPETARRALRRPRWKARCCAPCRWAPDARRRRRSRRP